jgi:acyl dehydratase
MAMYLHRVGAESSPARRTWQPRDCSLYALGVGAGFGELAFSAEGAEGHPQRVYPTFVLSGVMAAEAESWPDPAFETGDFPLHQVVHGAQALEVHAPIGPSGDVLTRTRVAGIHDKGSGALVVLQTRADDRTSGKAVFTATTSLFVTGQGGFGGDRGPASPKLEPPARAPDRRMAWATSPVQTLLWRHAGNDPNPIHFDPAVAARAGFEGPILMGLNTLGFAARALVHAVGGSAPERLRAIEGRFAAPGYNGDVLTAEIWTGDGVGRDAHGQPLALYRVVNQRGAVLLDRGRAAFSA